MVERRVVTIGGSAARANADDHKKRKIQNRSPQQQRQRRGKKKGGGSVAKEEEERQHSGQRKVTLEVRRSGGGDKNGAGRKRKDGGRVRNEDTPKDGVLGGHRVIQVLQQDKHKEVTQSSARAGDVKPRQSETAQKRKLASHLLRQGKIPEPRNEEPIGVDGKRKVAATVFGATGPRSSKKQRSSGAAVEENGCYGESLITIEAAKFIAAKHKFREIPGKLNADESKSKDQGDVVSFLADDGRQVRINVFPDSHVVGISLNALTNAQAFLRRVRTTSDLDEIFAKPESKLGNAYKPLLESKSRRWTPCKDLNSELHAELNRLISQSSFLEKEISVLQQLLQRRGETVPSEKESRNLMMEVVERKKDESEKAKTEIQLRKEIEMQVMEELEKSKADEARDLQKRLESEQTRVEQQRKRNDQDLERLEQNFKRLEQEHKHLEEDRKRLEQDQNRLEQDRKRLEQDRAHFQQSRKLLEQSQHDLETKLKDFQRREAELRQREDEEKRVSTRESNKGRRGGDGMEVDDRRGRDVNSDRRKNEQEESDRRGADNRSNLDNSRRYRDDRSRSPSDAKSRSRAEQPHQRKFSPSLERRRSQSGDPPEIRMDDDGADYHSCGPSIKYKFNSELEDLRLHWSNECSCIGMGDAWYVLIYENGLFHNVGPVPTGLLQSIMKKQMSGINPVYISGGSEDRFFVKFADNTVSWNGSPELDQIMSKHEHSSISKVVFGIPGQLYVIFTDNKRIHTRFPQPISNYLQSRNRKHKHIVDIAFGLKGEYFIKFEDGKWKGGKWSNALNNLLTKLTKQHKTIRRIMFGADNSFLVEHEP